MNPGFPSLFASSTRPRWGVAFALACLWAAACPSPAAAARAPSGGTRPVSSPVIGLPTGGRLSDSTNTDLAALSQAGRLITPPPQGYDIVPPERSPGETTTGPLPGYQIIRLGRGHNNRLYFPGTVAGIKGTMMLDTGAKTTVLNEATYRALLLNAAYHLPAGLPRAVDFNGTSAPLAEAPDFYVGKSNLGAVPVCLIPRRDLLDPSPGRLYDGLFGENILRHYNALVDCGRLVLYLDLDPARKINSSAAFVRNGWTRVPMSYTGSDFTVPCVLNGHKFRLLVDTGTPFTNLDRHLLAGAQVASHDLPLRSSLIGKEAVPVGLVDLDRLQIGNYTATGLHMITTSQSLAAFDGPRGSRSGEPIVGLLGGDTLANNGAVIDIGNQALYLKHTVSGKTPARPARG